MRVASGSGLAIALSCALAGCTFQPAAGDVLTPEIRDVDVPDAALALVHDSHQVVGVEDAEAAPPVSGTLAPPRVPLPPPRPKDPYRALLYDLELDRTELAWRHERGEDVYAEANAVLARHLPKLIDYWKGTRWSYSGTTQVPKKGNIACGYYVTTVLEHAGFEVDRVDLARQASEQILRSLIPDDDIERIYHWTPGRVASHIEDEEPGIYLVGLDTHIGFLVNEPGKPLQFCHSTRRDRKKGVICERASVSKSMKSRYTVVGRLGEPGLIDAWLSGAKLPTAHKLQPQAEILLGGTSDP